MTTYRTDKQFESIADSCENGNWTFAAKECIEYGFFSRDLINKNKKLKLFSDIYDLVELIEIATKLRNK